MNKMVSKYHFMKLLFSGTIDYQLISD